MAVDRCSGVIVKLERKRLAPVVGNSCADNVKCVFAFFSVFPSEAANQPKSLLPRGSLPEAAAAAHLEKVRRDNWPNPHESSCVLSA